jgi:aspartyl/asparaginyl beta-hydroxylase (cupin superfamily)
VEFATDLNRDDHAAALELLAEAKEWSKPKDKGDYYLSSLRPDSHPLLMGCKRAFFLKVEPGGHIHKHIDGAGKIFDSDLIVVTTNDKCRIHWERDGAEHSMHLELGHRYRMNDRASLHWATNDGDTARVNLMIEYAKN